MGKHIRTLTITTDAVITQEEIPLFRGAIVNRLGKEADILFHNHISDKTFRYTYPLIQYKQIGGMASIVCIEKGVDIIGQFLMSESDNLKIGQREIECNTKHIHPARVLVQTWQQPIGYTLKRWLPLNSQNYHTYKEIDSMVDRITFLEKILKANILSMLKGLDIHLESELIVKFTNLSQPYLVKNKGIKLMAFNANFESNVSIPNNIGIGKNASIGFGTVWMHRNHHKEENNNE